jgi:heme exporter protein B
MTEFLISMRYIFYTEVLLLWRRSHEWLYPLAFFMMTMSLFPLAFTADPLFLKKIMPGCIWLALLFATLLANGNIFATEVEDGYLEQLILSDTPLTLVIFIKIIAHWLIVQFPLILIAPLIGLVFHLNVDTIVMLCVTMFLGSPILTLIASLSVALTFGLRQQGVMLGLLMLPLITPVLIFGVNIVHEANAGFAVLGPCAFLAGLCVLSLTLLPIAIASALKISIDD